MIRLLTALIAGVGIFYAGIAVAQEPPTPVSCWDGDVNQNGHCTNADAVILQQNVFHNPEWADGLPDTPNPCVEWKVFDGTNDPDYAIIGLDGQWITPTGGMWLVPSDHPMIDSYRAGTPIPMIPCPG